MTGFSPGLFRAVQQYCLVLSNNYDRVLPRSVSLHKMTANTQKIPYPSYRLATTPLSHAGENPVHVVGKHYLMVLLPRYYWFWVMGSLSFLSFLFWECAAGCTWAVGVMNLISSEATIAQCYQGLLKPSSTMERLCAPESKACSSCPGFAPSFFWHYIHVHVLNFFMYMYMYMYNYTCTCTCILYMYIHVHVQVCIILYTS